MSTYSVILFNHATDTILSDHRHLTLDGAVRRVDIDTGFAERRLRQNGRDAETAARWVDEARRECWNALPFEDGEVLWMIGDSNLTIAVCAEGDA